MHKQSSTRIQRQKYISTDNRLPWKQGFGSRSLKDLSQSGMEGQRHDWIATTETDTSHLHFHTTTKHLYPITDKQH